MAGGTKKGGEIHVPIFLNGARWPGPYFPFDIYGFEKEKMEEFLLLVSHNGMVIIGFFLLVTHYVSTLQQIAQEAGLQPLRS